MVTTKKTVQDAAEKLEEQRLEAVDKLIDDGGVRPDDDKEQVSSHAGTQLLLPRGMSAAVGAKLLTTKAAADDESVVYVLPMHIRCRPWDGAYVLDKLLRDVFGIGSQGRTNYSFFGAVRPTYLPVPTGPKTSVSVPFGEMSFPLFEGTMNTGNKYDAEYGVLFDMNIICPRKYELAVNSLWSKLAKALETDSIYKGKAMVGVGKLGPNGSFQHPTFIDPHDPRTLDESKIAYSTEVYTALVNNIWGRIQTREMQHDSGLDLNRNVVFEGTNGVGKTLAALKTAKFAVDHGVTFIQAETGSEDIDVVMKTAELFEPSVVVFEDVELLQNTDSEGISKLMNRLDGLSNKGREVMIIMTTNHYDKLSKDMKRVGRIDMRITFGDLDAPAIRRLFESRFKSSELADDLDYDAITDAMAGYEPAFINGTFKDVKSNAVVRTNSVGSILTTEDFVTAANALRPLHDSRADAPESPVKGKVVLEDVISTELEKHAIDSEGQIILIGS